MAFDIILQTNLSESNKIDKTVTDIATVTGTLRQECSIIDPIIIIAGDLDDYTTCNYMTITQFGRKYFVNNIRSIREGLIEITAHVDVLSTYATQIRANSAILSKSESEWNLYLNDGSLRTYQKPTIITKTFPYGFSDVPEFVLTVAGS